MSFPLRPCSLLRRLVALLLPRIYKSTSTILIEEPEIPREYVTTTVTSYAEERLQTINQRVMSSTNLLEVIKRFNLYADLKDKWTTEEIVDKMRKEIEFETISANVINRRTGNPTEATIAFSLAYKGKDPAVVQQVANVLAFTLPGGKPQSHGSADHGCHKIPGRRDEIGPGVPGRS